MATRKSIIIIVEPIEKVKLLQIFSILNFRIDFYFKNGNNIEFNTESLETLFKEEYFSLQLSFNDVNNISTQIFCEITKAQSCYVLNFSLNQLFENEKEIMKEHFFTKSPEFLFKHLLFIDNNVDEDYTAKMISLFETFPIFIEQMVYKGSRH